jgi:tetratricopeptide (TPR) repeat protein
MEVSFTRHLGRMICGLVLCSLATPSIAAENGSMVFVDDESVPTEQNGSGSFVVVNEASQASKKPVRNPASSNQFSLRPHSQSAQGDVKVNPRQNTRQTTTPRNIVRSVAEPQPLSKGDQLLVEAHAASAAAQTETDLNEVIDKCVTALRLGVKGENKQFATQLISWSLNRRGQVYTGAGKPELADADFHEALHFDPNNWRALHNRGVSNAEAGQFAEAFDDFNRVIEMNPQFAKAYTNRATLFVQAGDIASAEKDYEQACQLDGKLVSARLGLARACHMTGRWDEALIHFTAAVELEPSNPGTLCSRGDLLADMGQYAEALASYAQAIEVKPSFGHAYRNGAWLLATCPDEQFRDPENAVLGAKQALESEYGERHVALDTLAAALASAGQFDEAISTLEEAIELAPSAIRPEYVARVKLYETGQPFRTQPVSDVSQAVYEETDIE